jgi:signal transduction histidine kinase
MSLKNKTALAISLLFSVIFASSATIIYILFEDFRKEEFENRLKEKALTSIKLLIEVEQVDRQLLKVIDQNSIHKLYDEKTLIFDANYNLIYSSLDDTKINWTINDLNHLKQHKTFFRKENENEVYGFFYDTNEKDYFALISANDSYGKRKLEYLFYILLFTYIVSTILAWYLTYTFVKYILSPIDLFHNQLKSISESNLDARIKVKEKKDEIDLLALEFNQMLERINYAYKKQQEFTSNASHELRTPLTRLSAQLENKIIEEKSKGTDNDFNLKLFKDINQLSELTNSLLLLSKLDSESTDINECCRIDELIFESFEKVNKLFPEFKMDFKMEEIDDLEINGNKSLLDIAFLNLIKNAYLYADKKLVEISLKTKDDQLIVTIANDGKLLSTEEQDHLFEPFLRGKNSKNISGMGLGLRIVKRILTQQKATIKYAISAQNKNVFTLTFNIKNT